MKTLLVTLMALFSITAFAMDEKADDQVDCSKINGDQGVKTFSTSDCTSQGFKVENGQCVDSSGAKKGIIKD